jgi:hypothetical protein
MVRTWDTDRLPWPELARSAQRLLTSVRGGSTLLWWANPTRNPTCFQAYNPLK